jgi:hypothetical protein
MFLIASRCIVLIPFVIIKNIKCLISLLAKLERRLHRQKMMPTNVAEVEK